MSYDGPERRHDYANFKEDVSKLKYIVFGNGEPGLAEQYRTLSASVKQIKEDIEESKKVRSQIVIGVATGIILTTFNLLLTLLKHA